MCAFMPEGCSVLNITSLRECRGGGLICTLPYYVYISGGALCIMSKNHVRS